MVSLFAFVLRSKIKLMQRHTLLPVRAHARAHAAPCARARAHLQLDMHVATACGRTGPILQTQHMKQILDSSVYQVQLAAAMCYTADVVLMVVPTS